MQLIKDNFDPDKLESLFITHLNRIYCAKLHLAKRLPEIENAANFIDLQNAIVETISIVEKQIVRMREIYELLNAEISIESHKGLTGLIEDAFIAIQQQRKDPILRDMSILFYMQNIESIEMTSFQVLQVVAIKLKNDEIKRLLQENFDAAKADRSLLMLIMAKYIAGKTPGDQSLK
jgi:ferritin-like metal-binding protein YciE